ncbi:MAG TPA: tRNA 2-thiouridine(34) synthase MnmA [Acidobacteriota bacterium]
MARVAVAMSGGVDSSTAAALLAEAGHEVVGLTLRLWDYSAENLASGRGRCCSPADIADARAVSDRLGVPHYVFDHAAGFHDHVVDPFVSGYQEGTTPSPCIRCNRLVKFDLLARLARGLDADYLATGHYARLGDSRLGDSGLGDSGGADSRPGDAGLGDSRLGISGFGASAAGRPQLRKARDAGKDQSYFLFDVPAERFAGVVFPLGGMAKDEVRRAARRLDVGVADKPESYELCFIPDGDKDRFVEERTGDHERPGGPIRHLDGRLLGYHGGLHRFTVGQRRGLGISQPEPLFVIELDAASKTVVVGPDGALDADHLLAGRCNWVSIEPPRQPLRAAARIRHRHREVGALITPRGEDRVRVDFDRPQRAVTPGQGVAFYDGDLLLGGGWIER